MKCISLALFLFLSYAGLSQYIIRLSYKAGAFPGYRILKAEDSTLVKVGYNEDMGVPYRNYYRLRSSMSDGHYQVYVNDTIAEDVSIKNDKPYGTRTTYFKGKKSSQQVFINSEESLYRYFYPNGKTKNISRLKGRAPYIRVSYYETGAVSLLEYFINNTHSRIEHFDENGYVTRVDDEYNPEAKFVAAEVSYNKGRFEGKHLIRFEEGDFVLEFSGGKPLTWKFMSKGEVLNELDLKEYKK